MRKPLEQLHGYHREQRLEREFLEHDDWKPLPCALVLSLDEALESKQVECYKVNLKEKIRIEPFHMMSLIPR